MKVPRAAIPVVLTLGLLAAPLGAEAQAPPRVVRIGWLSADARPVDVATYAYGNRRFHEALLALGYVEGQHYVTEYRFGDGLARLPTLAAELVALPVDLIVTLGADATLAAKAASPTVPIVFNVGGDPVARGLVASYARPGGNVTGVAIGYFEDKLLQVLKEAVPGMSRVGLICTCSDPTPQTPYNKYLRTTFATAARTLGVQVQYIDVKDSTELARALASTATANIGGLVVANQFGLDQEKQIAEFTRTHRLPSSCVGKGFANFGGLISYGPKAGQSLGRMAAMVDKILKGAKPSELPVEGPTLYELVLNLKTAKAIGLTFPPSVRLQADTIIE